MRKTLWLSSFSILILAGIAASIGILYPNVYNDNGFLKTAWLSNDWITITIAIPTLLSVMFFWKRYQIKADLVWLGLMNYFFYNYSFYLFGSAFNSIFLIYVLICSLSFFSMLGFLSLLNVNEIAFERITTKWITIFLLLLSCMLCLIEIPSCLQFISNGKLPELNLKTGQPTNIVYALDLTFVVPAMLIASVLNLKKNVWGGVISIMMLVKAAMYGLVLTSGTIQLIKQGETDPLLPIWIFISLGGIIGLFFMLKTSRVKESI